MFMFKQCHDNAEFAVSYTPWHVCSVNSNFCETFQSMVGGRLIGLFSNLELLLYWLAVRPYHPPYTHRKFHGNPKESEINIFAAGALATSGSCCKLHQSTTRHTPWKVSRKSNGFPLCSNFQQISFAFEFPREA